MDVWEQQFQSVSLPDNSLQFSTIPYNSLQFTSRRDLTPFNFFCFETILQVAIVAQSLLIHADDAENACVTETLCQSRAKSDFLSCFRHRSNSILLAKKATLEDGGEAQHSEYDSPPEVGKGISFG
jgi:hypothetical protein